MNKESSMLSQHLSLAKLPATNPISIDDFSLWGTHTLTLIDHDYPGRTPALWNALYKNFGIDAVMVMVVGNPSATKEIIASFRKDVRYVGGGSGSGFKEIVLNELDDVTVLAKAIGAVNVIKRESDGRLIGDNTDGAGYADSLDQVMRAQNRELKGSKVLILGAGGTGRAIAFTLADRGASLVILNRTKGKAFELSESVNMHFGRVVAVGGGRELIAEYLPSCDAVVSVIDDAASPLEEYSTLGEMDLPVTSESREHNRLTTVALLKTALPSLVVSDIRLRNGETPMLSQAREHGFTVLDGVPMVVNQGVAAFWWLYGDMLTVQGISRDDVSKLMWEVVQK
jgi:shikimate dehydrogenase